MTEDEFEFTTVPMTAEMMAELLDTFCLALKPDDECLIGAPPEPPPPPEDGP
ncbi:MAG: hypothetical protein AAFX94_05945 [Myxococcota bacterium]